MFLQLNLKNLRLYKLSREMVKACYEITKQLPSEEKFNLISQIRRAALSIKLNVAEGSSRKSELERKRYYEAAGGSVIEVDAAIETAVDIGYSTPEHLVELGRRLNQNFGLLSSMV